MTMVGPASKVKPSWRKTEARPPGCVEALEDGDAVAASAEADGGGEAAEAAADDDGVGPGVALVAQLCGCQCVHTDESVSRSRHAGEEGFVGLPSESGFGD